MNAQSHLCTSTSKCDQLPMLIVYLCLQNLRQLTCKCRPPLLQYSSGVMSEYFNPYIPILHGHFRVVCFEMSDKMMVFCLCVLASNGAWLSCL